MSATCASACSSDCRTSIRTSSRMVVQHELQHAETIAQTLALAGLLGAYALPPVEASGEVVVPGGSFTQGSTDAWAYDNERPPHAVDAADVPHRPRARDERRVGGVHGRGRLPRP